jgi:hypothetical protein
MADVYLFADETGNLDLSGGPGASAYFGFGTAVFGQDHGECLMDGLRLRCGLEASGVRLPEGLHAKNDSHPTREQVFQLIREQAPRFDATFLNKQRAYDRVRQAGQIYLYKLAWFLHFKHVAVSVSSPGDRLYVVIGSLQTNNKRDAIRSALEDVCRQVSGRTIVPCIWKASSAWGLQVADYGLWATQRHLEGRECKWYETCVEPTLRTRFFPWGQA